MKGDLSRNDRTTKHVGAGPPRKFISSESFQDVEDAAPEDKSVLVPRFFLTFSV